MSCYFQPFCFFQIFRNSRLFVIKRIDSIFDLLPAQAECMEPSYKKMGNFLSSHTITCWMKNESWIPIS